MPCHSRNNLYKTLVNSFRIIYIHVPAALLAQSVYPYAGGRSHDRIDHAQAFHAGGNVAAPRGVVMIPARKKRLYWILALMCGASAAVALALAALRENINLFYTPSQIAAGDAPHGTRIRAGGLVEKGSLKRTSDSLALRFTVTDGARSIVVRYRGILPDLFREGQGIVALGKLEQDGILHADEVLAKHDENYMPPEAMHALKQASAADRLPRVGEESGR